MTRSVIFRISMIFIPTLEHYTHSPSYSTALGHMRHRRYRIVAGGRGGIPACPRPIYILPLTPEPESSLTLTLSLVLFPTSTSTSSSSSPSSSSSSHAFQTHLTPAPNRLPFSARPLVPQPSWPAQRIRNSACPHHRSEHTSINALSLTAPRGGRARPTARLRRAWANARLRTPAGMARRRRRPA